MFGKGHSIPSSNDTRWNSVYRQIKYVIELDSEKLRDVLRKEEQQFLILNQKEQQQLQELIAILEQFADATDLAQGSDYVTISCVVPILLSLNQNLTSQLNSVKHHSPLVRELLRSLHVRFHGLFEQLSLSCPISIPSTSTSKDLSFNSSVYLLAACIDPQHGYRWLERHPGSVAQKECLKNNIFGMLILFTYIIVFKH